MRTRSDSAWAWACALLAAVVSIAVNVGHAAPVSWGFVAFAATLPVMIVGAAELMVRRLLPAWIVGVIGISAYALSFWHTVLLLLSWHEPLPLAVLGSVAVDGLMVGATVALYRTRRAPDARASAPDVRPDAAPDAQPGHVRTPDAEPDTAGQSPDVTDIRRPARKSAAREAVDAELIARGLPTLTADVLAEVIEATGAGASTIRNRLTALKKEVA